MHIRWSNETRVVDGIHVWSASSGELVLRRELFKNEIESFDRRFLNAMAEQISIIEREGPPDIALDIGELQTEHEQRIATSATKRTRAPAVRDWPAIIAANHALVDIGVDNKP